MRKPFIVAIANYLFPGLGYVMLGQRSVFGWILMIGLSVQIVQLLIDPLPYAIVYGSTPFSVALGVAAIFILEVAFAYDAYHLAKRA